MLFKAKNVRSETAMQNRLDAESETGRRALDDAQFARESAYRTNPDEPVRQALIPAIWSGQMDQTEQAA